MGCEYQEKEIIRRVIIEICYHYNIIKQTDFVREIYHCPQPKNGYNKYIDLQCL